MSPGASARAIQKHYDLGNDFFRLFLDETRTYSCALFADEADTLEAAQRRKQDWHVEHAGARGAARVLDVGCGWGATLERMVTAHGVGRAVGLTLSEAQRAFVADQRLPGVEVRLESWTEHQPEAPYDAIISIGAFEHFARFKISPAEKIAGYRQYFVRCRELLVEGGRMTVQTMAYGDIPRDRVYADEFIADEIFPESDFPRLADIAEACEGEFEVLSLRNDRHDYARTYRAWFDNLRAHRDEAIALVGQEAYARHERYLRTFSYSFALGAFQLLRLTFGRVDHRRHPAAGARRSAS